MQLPMAVPPIAPLAPNRQNVVNALAMRGGGGYGGGGRMEQN